METITVNIAAYADFYGKKKDDMLFPPPPPPSCPEPPTSPIISYLDRVKDKWQGSTISVVIRASNPWKLYHCEYGSKC
jgi:hypothetical protein